MNVLVRTCLSQSVNVPAGPVHGAAITECLNAMPRKLIKLVSGWWRHWYLGAGILKSVLELLMILSCSDGETAQPKTWIGPFFASPW